MPLLKKLFSLFFFLNIFLTFLFFGCNGQNSLAPNSPEEDRKKTKPEETEQKDKDKTPDEESVKVISSEDLHGKYGFIIPPSQETGDLLPPQPGAKLFGHTVKGGPNSDTNWTAFTLVLFKDAAGYKLLTQKRAFNPMGVLETPGGHLLGGQTWREGARDELSQEAGIVISPSDLIFIGGANPRLSFNNNLIGNANFFVVFNKQPATSEDNDEIDKSYGHQWLDLKTIYEDVVQEQKTLGFKHGKYYSFFRGHLLQFCQKVILCEKL